MKKAQKILKSGLHVLLWKEVDLYVAKGIEVEVTSQAKTEKEAIKNIEEALDLFFEDEKVTIPKSLNMLELLKISLNSSYA